MIEKVGEVIIEEVKGIKKSVEAAAGKLKVFLNDLASALKIKELSYVEVMKYLHAHKKDSPKIKKCAVCKEVETTGSHLVSAIFLDQDDEPVMDNMGRPIGCQWSVERLDDELQGTFKDKNMFIVQ